MNDVGGIQMTWGAILIGILIGYMIYQRRQQNSPSENDHTGHDQRGKETDSCSYIARSIQDDMPRGAGPEGEYREINEAVVSGERALESLRTAKSKLDSARAWGIYDMIGGGFLSGMIKHGQMDQANEWMDRANHDLRNFAKELRDVPGEYLHIQTGDFISMLDIFCDNFFSDIMVQSRINDARARLDQTISSVQEAVRALKKKAMN